MYNREMTTSTLPVFLAVVLVVSVSVNGYKYAVYASGPKLRLDWDEKYEDIPGAPEWWVDGYDDGLENPFDHDRHEECKDKSNQYYRAFIVGCKDACNTEEICEQFTDK